MKRPEPRWHAVARSAARFAKGSAILSVLLPAAAILFNLFLGLLGLPEGALLAELLVRVEYCLVPVGMMVWGGVHRGPPRIAGRLVHVEGVRARAEGIRKT